MKLIPIVCLIGLVYLSSITLSCFAESDAQNRGMNDSAIIWRIIPLEISEPAPMLEVAPQVLSSNISSEKTFISGTAFNDLNGDGFKEVNEPGLSNWTIVLSCDGKYIREATTNTEGLYSFENLKPGNYTVEEKVMAGWNQTSPPQESYNINFVYGQGFNYDFGNIQGPVLTAPGAMSRPLLSRGEWLRMIRELETAPNSTMGYEQRTAVSYPSSFSLLGYVPSYDQRNQGSCGNCWAWACAGLTEIAHYAQSNILDRLSIQYLNSNFEGGSGRWACCGGNIGDYLNFYNSEGKFVPWNNLNAQYQDGANHCCHYCSAGVCTTTSCCSQTGCGGVGHSSVSASSINESPNYPINAIPNYYYLNHGITQDQAIDTIKSVLTQNKAMVFSFYLPSAAAWNSFENIWYSGGIWDPATYCGQPVSAGSGGHAVLCVGYDDASDTWIMLNSWGPRGRGDGTFRVKMHMNYDCSNDGDYSYWFEGFDVTFVSNGAPATPSIPSGPSSGVSGTSYSYSTLANDPDGDQVKYTFDWGDVTTSETGMVNSGTEATASHTWTVPAGTTTTFNVRARATDSKGLSSTDWSNPITVSITGPPNTDWRSGRTTPGATNWKVNNANSIYVDVDTAAAGFTATPLYFTSLGGSGSQYNAQGISGIYSATATGFRTYLRNWNGASLSPAQAKSNKWYVQWLGVPTTNVNSGSTPKGTTNWKAYGANAIYVDVNTAAAGFTATPRYFTSLGGTSSQYNAQGFNAIYSATATGFRIYLRNWNGAALTPAYANSKGWHVQWLGV
jgi:hypothetical protein